MEHKSYSILVNVQGGSGMDAEDLDELTHLLADELNELDDVESVKQPASTNLPAGAKGAPIDIGAVLISIATGGGLSALASFFSNWLSSAWLSRRQRCWRSLENSLFSPSASLQRSASV